MDDREGRQISPCQSQDRLQPAKKRIALCPVGRGCPLHPAGDQRLSRDESRPNGAPFTASRAERSRRMNGPCHATSGVYLNDPADTIDRPANEQPSAFAIASHGLTRIKEWATRGKAKQRALRHDLVTLSLCPQMLPCKHPSAAWCARKHGVSRQWASRLQQDFAREFGDHLQFRGQRFLNQANAAQ